MTVKELKEAIENLPDSMDVFMDERRTEYNYGLVNSAFVREIDFSDEWDEAVVATDKVLIISEE